MKSIIWKKIVCLGIALGTGLIITGGVMREKALEIKIEETQEGLAEEVFRFHVLANSNSEADQSLKIRVRDAVLSYMKEEMPESEDVNTTKYWVKEHLQELERVAEMVIYDQGYRYEATAQVEAVEFPAKSYGDVTLPAGEYEALRIIIGEGKGNNWWCVLYPNLCFLDSVHAVVPEEEKEELKEVLTEEEYEMVTMGTKFKIKWFFFGE